MSPQPWSPNTIRVRFTTGGAAEASEQSAPAASAFRYEDWARDLRSLMANAKQGIELTDDHADRLNIYLLYVKRLGVFLKKLPGFDGAQEPLEWLADEIDLLHNHWTSDLLRPAAASRQTPTNAAIRMRMLAVLFVQLHIQVGVDDDRARQLVADALWARGYRGDKGRFNANELKNWASKVENGEYRGAREMIAKMFDTLPTLRCASSEADAASLMDQMLDRVRMPPMSRTQLQKQRPLP